MGIGQYLSEIPTRAMDLRERGYAFQQKRGLNDAWAQSLDETGRPDEIKFHAAAKRAGLGPDAASTYWKQQTEAFKNAQEQAQAANMIETLGGNFRGIKGEAPLPEVREVPTPGFDEIPGNAPAAAPRAAAPAAPGSLVSGFIRGGSQTVPLSTPAPVPDVQDNGEPTIVVSGSVQDTRAPEVGLLPPDTTTYERGPVPLQGVATEFARSIRPTFPGMMTQASQAGAPGEVATEAPAPSLSFESMNPTERAYAERFLARSSIPGATPAEQLQAFETNALQGIARPVPFNPQRGMVATPGGGMILDPSKLAEERNRAAADQARFQAESSKAIADARKAMFGAYEGVQAPTIARAGAESSLLEKSRPIMAANEVVAAMNRELGTSFDPSKMGDPKVAAEVVERVRLQKSLAQRADSLEVVRGPDGSIDGRATLSQIVPMLEGMAKLEGLSGTEGTQKMMIGLLAPKLDAATMLAAGMIDASGGLTGAGLQYLAGRVNDIPIEQVRKLARHMVDASPGMAGIYQNYQSKVPRAMATASLDSFGSAAPGAPSQDQGAAGGSVGVPAHGNGVGEYLRPREPRTPVHPPVTAAHGVTPAQFDRAWANAKPGDKVVGPDGKTYTKKGAH